MKLSTLPNTVRVALDQLRKSGTGADSLYIRQPSKEIQQQGTRATMSQGTSSSGNTPDPLHPGRTITPNQALGWDRLMDPELDQFSTTKEVRDGTEGTIIQTRDWPPNPSTESLSPSIGHAEQLRTDAAIQLGMGPGRIERYLPARIWGVTNAATGGRGTEQSYGGNIADHDFLAHLPIARRALGTKGPQKLSDDNAVVPAVYAGNPRP